MLSGTTHNCESQTDQEDIDTEQTQLPPAAEPTVLVQIEPEESRQAKGNQLAEILAVMRPTASPRTSLNTRMLPAMIHDKTQRVAQMLAHTSLAVKDRVCIESVPRKIRR